MHGREEASRRGGARTYGPAISVEHGAVHLFVESSQVFDFPLGAFPIFEAIVGDGQADILFRHVGSARFIEAFADVLKGWDDGPRVGLWPGEGFEAVGGGVPV